MSELDEIREMIDQWVAEGFDTPDEMLESALDDADPALEAPIRAYLQESLKRHAETEATWDQPTDCDKLDAAFERLNQLGIVARQHYSCCQRCGGAEISGEMRELATSRTVLGYAFYDMQDTEIAIEDGGLCVSFGAMEYTPEKRIAIGRQVAETLQQAGLPVEWSGRADERIYIAPIEWKRRRNV